MAEIGVSFEHDARASYAPDFLDRCLRIVGGMDGRIGPFSIRFLKAYTKGPTEIFSLVASVAWRNEVFAFLHHPLNEMSKEVGIVIVSDPQRKVYSKRAFTECEAARELPMLFLMHIKEILKKHELRVRHARVALNTLEAGHPPGLEQR